MKNSTLILIFLLSILSIKSYSQDCTITGPAAITNVCTGGVPSISVSATGGTGGFTYQWYSNTSASNTGGSVIPTATGSSYNPPSATAGTFYYYCVVTGTGCGPNPSSVAVINVAEDPMITAEPVSPAAICTGATTSSMSVTAAGGTPSLVYQWQYNNSGSWEAVSNGTPAGSVYTGATGTSFSVAGISLEGVYQYRCFVSAAGDGCGTASSAVVSVTVVAPPSISSEPVSPAAICPGATTGAMTITASGGTPQWQYNNSGTWENVSDGIPAGSTYAGSTGTSFTVSGISSAGTYVYRCLIVSASCTAAISSTVTVAVNSPATITSQPSSPSPICPTGTTGAITIGASGTSLSYQWQYNNSGTWVNVSAGVPAGSAYTGATGSSFTVAGISSAGFFDYRCIITGACGSVTSNTISVEVKERPAITDMAENVGTGSPFSFTPVNGVNGTVPSGTTYSWTVSADASISGEANGTDQASVWGTLSHTKSGVKTATYTVTPKSGTCTGVAFAIVVSVYPKPIITSKTATICSGGTFNATPTDGMVDVVPSGTTYTWPLPVAPGVSGLASGSNSASISGTLSNSTASPITVTYVVTPKSGSQAGDPFNVAVTVNPVPSPTISGSGTVCYSSTENYTTEAGKSGYTWTVSGGTITSGAGTNAISVLWNAAGPGFVRVNYTYLGCTPASPTEKSITVRPAITLTGAYQASTVCSGQAATINLSGLQPLSTPVIDYTINGIPQAQATGIAADGSGNSSFTTGGLIPSYNGKILRVTKITTGTAPACFANFTVETPPLIVNTATTPAISGNASPCINSTGNVYATEPGMSDYTWVVSAGGTITAGGDPASNTVTVTWNSSGARSVSVSYTNSGGCVSPAPTVMAIDVKPLPVPVINGPSTVCAGSAGNVYTTDPGMLSYTWTVTGGTVTSGGTGNMIIVTWNTTGTVKVNYVNANNCTAATETVKNVTVNPLPVISLTGNTSVCDGSVNVYTTDAAKSNYLWEVSTGGSIISGGTPTDNTISIKWSSSGARTVKVNYVEPGTSCTAAASKTLNITVNDLPAPSISGPSSVLVGSSANVYTTEGSMTGYTWTVPAGGVITAGTGTNQITVTWTTGGTKTITLNYINGNSCTAMTPSAKNVSVNSLPVAGGLSISGTARVGSTLTAVYSYSDAEGDPEGGTTINWFRDTDGSGTTWTSVTGPLTTKTYVLTNSDFGKKIRFELVPVAASGALTSVITYTSASTAIIVNPAPVASSVSIAGSMDVGDAITGQYSYQDAEGDIENGSLYKWYSGPAGGPFTIIPGETSVTHVIKINEQGLYFRFEVTPVANGGTLTGITKTSPSFGPANTKPSATGVFVTGTPEVLRTLTGNYTFSDPDVADHEGSSVYRWLRDGNPITGAGSITYTLTADDEGSQIAFEVVPVSSTGYPYTGDPVRSAPTAAVTDPSPDVPVASEVCIEGIWSAGQRITGKYFYDFVKSEGASEYQWYSNNVAIPGANSISYVLTTSDINSRADITFSVLPKSSNKPAKTGLLVMSPPLSIIQLPKDEFSVAEPAIILTTNDPRIDGSFAGPGISGNKFTPLAAGTLGSPHTIVYFVNIVNSHHNCSQQSSRQVAVTTTAAYFEGIDPVYCQDKGLDVINVRNAPALAELSFWDFTCTDPDAIVTKSFASVTIDTRKLRPQRGVDKLVFKYVRFGSSYQLEQPLSVDSVGTAIRIINLDPEYCQDAPRKYVSVEGIYPLGGSADWNGFILSDTIVASAYVNPSKGTAGSSYPVRYQYISPDGCRSALITRSVKINPLPVTTFLLNPNCNIEGGPINLVPDQSGGLFNGDGVSGSIGSQRLYPDIADLGPHTITYSIRDAKGCDDTLSKITTVRRALATFADIPEAICYRDTTYIVKVNNLPSSDLAITGFTNTKGTLVYSHPDTKASYNVVAAGAGDDELVFSYKWYGVDFSIKKRIYVDKLNAATIGGISSGDTICIGQGTRQLYPLPEGGVFTGPVTGGFLDPSLATAGVTSYTVSYKYVNAKTLCSTSTAVPIKIFPSPKVAFKAADLCIDDDSDPAQFVNETTSSDPVASWNWSFTEAGNTSSSNTQDASYLFKAGGLLGVSLKASTIYGCTDQKDITYDMARKPVADFYVKRDCFKPGEFLELRDTSKVYTAAAKAWEWQVNGTVTGNSKTSVYLKTDTGYIHVRYTVKTDPKYLNCNSTISKDVYIRPTKLLTGSSYQEDFEFGRNGWTRTDSLNIWTFGLPDGNYIKTAASGTHSWFTRNLKKGWVEVESPCFDFSVIERPVINMKSASFFDKDRDGAVLQYRIGDSKDWINVGTINDGLEWYNSATIRGVPGKSQVGWTSEGHNDTGWKESSHSLDELKGKKNVRFRIAYGSEGNASEHDGFAFDDVSIGERTRKVLIEHFTNIWDKPANQANAVVNSITAGRQEDVLNIQYHTGFPISDPFYEENSGEANARVLFYGLTRVPYTFIDGGTTNEHAMVFDNVISKIDPNEVTKRTLINSKFRIDYDVVISGTVLTINDITITPLMNLTGTAADREIVRNLTLYLAVTEKENSNHVGNQESVFRQVFKKFVPDAGGIIVEHAPVWQKGVSMNLPDQTWHISNIMNATSLEVIGWLQNSVSREIYQAHSVDQSITVGTDDAHISEVEGFALYPNPAKETFRIDFSQPLKSQAEIKIYNYRGEVVRFFRAGAGSTEFIVNNPGLKGGLYLIKVTSGLFDLGYKKLVILGD